VAFSKPGIGTYYRTGYAEKDLVDYNTQNLKAGAAFHYKMKKDVELILASNFGTGTTVYQGDNRYSLKDILFFQNRLEIRKQDKFFIRAYATNEDAGKSYDAYFTALLLQKAAKSDQIWSEDYEKYFVQSGAYNNMKAYLNENHPPPDPSDPNYSQLFEAYVKTINPYLQANYDSLSYYHDNGRFFADNYISTNGQIAGFVPFFYPGTARFDSIFNKITTSKSYSGGGSGFYDKSALYHLQGEYKFTVGKTDFVTGGNGRLYKPNSDGTIFSDTNGIKLENYEVGVYGGVERKVLNDRLKINLTGRLDKNENFDLLFSPAASLVYTVNPNHILRFSFGSAIRNPTLSDQYLYYNVGRAILVGNVNGYESLVTVPSLQAAYRRYPPVIDSLKYFDIAPIRPERVRTVEAGYRASLLQNLYVDITAYYSVYKDFIGYKLGAQVDTASNIFGDIIAIRNILRVSSNSEDIVSTQGIAIGMNYFLGKYYTASANWSWNELDKRDSDDPIIPAYNTPKNKVNIGFSGRDMEGMLFKKFRYTHIGFAVNYKWVQGFLYEGSPQFTGEIDEYAVLDVQINKRIPKIKSTFKLGASNVLNNEHYEVYGGPQVGRLAYFSVLVELY
jgi:iron complex outermembrane recepter protein